MRVFQLIVFNCLIWTGAQSVAQAEDSSSRMHLENLKVSTQKPYELLMLFKSGLAQYSNVSDEKTAGNLRVESLFRYKFMDGLNFKADVRLGLLAQRSQQDISTDAFDDGFRMKQAYFEYEPLNKIKLMAGVVNQDKLFLSIPLLLDDRGFPGLAQSATFTNGENQLTFFAFEAVPTSRSLNTNRIEKEKTPVYLSQGLKGEWHLREDLTVTPFLMHYSFQNLPSVVASEGYSEGNSLAFWTTESNAVFKYNFNGITAGSNLKYQFASKSSATLGYTYIQNLSAPQAYNSGALLSGELNLRYQDMAFRPALFSFYNESDTSPAAYNDLRFGHNNREGYGGQMRVDFLKWKFSTTARYIGADVINQTANHQSQSEYFELVLETNYADIL